ncbi:MAG: CoA-binding protein [Candidatus Latescibacteria bacterium]|nr:CoA-binding protein [Candidatus Latescibacterota bacterium]
MSEVCEIPRIRATSEEIRDILHHAQVIAVVGLSANPERDSHGVARFLMEQGYEVIPVNPNYPEVLGQKSYPSLLDIPLGIRVDVVDIFRRMEAVPEIVDQAIQVGAKVIWMQEGIVHNTAAEKAREAGLKVVMNRCMMKEYRGHFLATSSR